MMKKIKKDIWNKLDGKTQFKDANFVTIIDFYVFNTPARNINISSKTFPLYGWARSNIFKKLKKDLLNHSNINRDTRYKFCSKDNIYSELNVISFSEGVDPSSIEAVVFMKINDHGEIDSLFTAIRHALAHGRFKIFRINGLKYYAFESRRNNEIRARIILEETTLIYWIKVVKKGPVN